MQVNSLPQAPTPGAIAPALLLPDLGRLLQRSDAGRVRQTIAAEKREHRERRRSAAVNDALAAGLSAPQPSEVALEAERAMRPGSHAARAVQLQGQPESRAANRAFRQALNQASERPGVNAGDATVARPGTEPRRAAGNESTPTATAPTVAAALGPASSAAGEHGAPTTSGPAPAPTRVAAINARTAMAAPPDLVRPAPVAATAVGRAAPTGRVAAAIPGSAALPTTSGPRPVPGAIPSTAATRPPDSRPVGSAAPAGTSSAAESRNADENVARMVRLVQSRIGRDRSVAHLRLDPPELGTVRLHMDLRQDVLALRVETQTDAAQRLLEDQLETLRRNLEAAGLRLERIEVRMAPAAPERAEPGQMWPGFTPGNPDQQARHEAPFAGGDGTSGTDSPGSGAPAATQASADDGGAPLQPAAESLVDVIA